MAAVAATGLDEPVSAPAPSVQVTKCENHNPTIEEVADEEDIIKRHETPLSNSVLEADDDPEPLIAPKPIAKTKPAPIISSQEEFPALNGSRAKTPIVASQWGSNMSTGTPATGTSATASGAATPTSTATTEAKRMEMHIPGQYSRQMMLAPQYMVPKSKMKRSIPEILKDVSRKTNTKVTTRGGANGSMWFTAVGPNASQTEKAMLDIADQIGAEVCNPVQLKHGLY